MNDIKEKVKVLTSINDTMASKFIEAIVYSIVDSVMDDFKNDRSISDCDIGIGTLSIKLDNDMLKMKFTPSTQLTGDIIKSIKQGKSTLQYTIEKSLVDRLLSIDKGII